MLISGGIDPISLFVRRFLWRQNTKIVLLVINTSEQAKDKCAYLAHFAFRFCHKAVLAREHTYILIKMARSKLTQRTVDNEIDRHAGNTQHLACNSQRSQHYEFANLWRNRASQIGVKVEQASAQSQYEFAC
jgi:hypothetical protein